MGVANYDVVVVGAGAAGLSAAIGLAKNDFSVLVLESGAYPGAENWSGCVYFAESLADAELLGPDGVEALAWERRLIERGIFSGNGHSFAGATYRDPDAFRNCYTVLRPIFDHHLAQVARQCGATILADTTAEGLIRERGRVIGVSTQRGPVYADLVFLAEGDASHLVTKEGYEQAAAGRQDGHFLQGVKQVIEMPPGAIEEIYRVGPEEGVAYEMLLRNGRISGRETCLNMGGFLYTNRDSISLGFVLPLNHLNDGFGGDPNMLMEWLRGLPEIRRWTQGGRPGVFGAKLIRGGGLREVPRLVDHGLAIGGAASGIGVDFPYPNFTGPATGMGLLLARAAIAIRRDGGSFTHDELERHYRQPLAESHWYADVHHLRRWPGYVEKTKFFFASAIDALQGSLYTWTRPELSLASKWREWTHLVRHTLPPKRWGDFTADSRQFIQALGLREVVGYRPVWRVLFDGLINSVRDLFGRQRPHVETAGQLTWHFSVLGGKEPVGPLPAAVANWAHRLDPILRSVAREIYRNDPVPLRDKLGTVLNRLVEQVNLLDVLAVTGLGMLFGITAGVQALRDQWRRMWGRPPRDSLLNRWLEETCLAGEYVRSQPASAGAAGGRDEESDPWEEKLSRVSYESIKDSHIKLFWPRDLTRRGAIAQDGIWHVCPANVYECHQGVAGQLRLVVNFENCIKCESCWRANPAVDWGRNGGHQLTYRVVSPAMGRTLEALDRAYERRPRPAKARDWWSTAINRIAQRAALSGGNGQFAGALCHIDMLCAMIESKLRELDRALAAEPRTMDQARGRWIETLATYAKQLVEELVNTVRDGPMAQAKEAGLRDVHSALVEAASSLRAKMSDLTRRAYDRQFFWAAADGRQIIGHQLEGLRRVVRLLRGHFAPTPPEPPPSTRWLQAERFDEHSAALRGEIAQTLDQAFEPLAWRSIDNGTPWSEEQAEAIKSVCRSVKAGGLAPGSDRQLLLSELGRRIPSLAYVAASHFWARDILRVIGGAAFDDLADRFARGDEFAAFAWEGIVEIDRDDEGSRLRGQKYFVSTALAQWFVVVADANLVVLPRHTPGLRIEPLGTIGMRGAAPATLVLDNVVLPATHRRVDKDQLERLWAVQSAVDLASMACGMADRFQARAIEHATNRVQFPGLFLDDESRESIGKFGAVKKMLAQIGARRYVLETLVHQFSANDLSDETCRRALELKILAAESMNGHMGSIPYNATQIFGGTGYSEEDFLPMFYRDSSTLLTLGVPNAQAAEVLGRSLIQRHAQLAAHGDMTHASRRVLVGLPESALFDEISQRKALQRELETLRRVRHEVESAVSGWQSAAVADPHVQAIADIAAAGLGQRQAEFIAAEAAVLRTHARLESGRPSELQIELVRTWLQDVVDSAHAWVDWLTDRESHVPLPVIQPPPPRSHVQTSYASILESPAPYQTGDFLIKPFDPAAARYVPEFVPFEPELGRYDRELDDLLRRNYRDRVFNGLSYERHVEQQHKLDPNDFELFRQHGFLKMYVPKEFGGLGASKALYNILVKNLIRNGDVGQTLTVQANSSIGTVPVLLGLYKELPRAQKDLDEFRGQERIRRELAAEFAQVCALAQSRPFPEVERAFRRLEKQVHKQIGSRPVLRVIYHAVLEKLALAAEAVQQHNMRDLSARVSVAADALQACDQMMIGEFAEELERRREGLTHFFRWIASGQMTAFALTEPSAGSDTARVATRAVLRSVVVHSNPDGSFRFTPVAGVGERRVIDSRRLEFRPEGAFYRWSDHHEPVRIMFDEYDYDADDSDRPRYYMAGPVKVSFHDIAQIRSRSGKLYYDYWELNGAKMWLTNARMCGVMVLYAKTQYGVTSFYVDRHAEGLLVGKNEEKMGQKASVTNELGLQAVRVARENVNGLEGRGQVNALEALNAGRSGLTTSSTTSMEDLFVRTERYTHARYPQLPAAIRQRLEEIAEIRYMCEAIACELVVRADHRDTQTFRVEPSIGKMMTSELLMRVIQLCEEIYGLEGHTTLHNLEKHKRDHRIITVYEGTNEIQRTVILKDLVREILPRHGAAPGTTIRSPGGTEKLHIQRGELEEMKQELARVLREAVTIFGDEITANPNLQEVFFGLADAAAWIKLADATLGRTEWVLRHLGAADDAAYRDWSVRITRRVIARLRQQVRQRLAHVTESMGALRRGVYPPTVRAASLMMSPVPDAAVALPARLHEVSRAIQIVVVVELEPTVSPQPAIHDGRWSEPHYRMDVADRSALAVARSIAAAASAPARIVAVGAGPRRAARILEEALAFGADDAIHVQTDDRTIAPESVARAIARVIETTCRSPDLILARSLSESACGGVTGMLTARELGLRFIPRAQQCAIRFTEDEASALVRSDHRPKPLRLSLPVALGIASSGDPVPFRIPEFLASLERSVRFVAWPEEITRRFVRLASGSGSATSANKSQPISRLTPDAAATFLLGQMGLESDIESRESTDETRYAMQSTDKLPVRAGAVLFAGGTDSSGRLRAADRRAARVASALARHRNRPFHALVFVPADELAHGRAAGDMASLGADSITLAVLDRFPDTRVLGEVWSQILMDHWSPEWSGFSAIVAGLWAEPPLGRFGPRQAELVFRTSELAQGPNTFILRSGRVDGKVDAFRELPADDLKPIWITVSDSIECDAPPRTEVLDPQVRRWNLELNQLPSRRELVDLLEQVRESTGLGRLTDADFIIDVGFGIGSTDGYEEIILPLERLLREIGVPSVAIGASRKVTEELKVVPSSRQIGQTGQAVNPIILLAIGISGAPQHLNYIGPRATILAFNRDPEAPIMTLNERQPRPRVFPIVGDLFQTIPAFMAALGEYVETRPGAAAEPEAATLG